MEKGFCGTITAKPDIFTPSVTAAFALLQSGVTRQVENEKPKLGLATIGRHQALAVFVPRLRSVDNLLICQLGTYSGPNHHTSHSKVALSATRYEILAPTLHEWRQRRAFGAELDEVDRRPNKGKPNRLNLDQLVGLPRIEVAKRVACLSDYEFMFGIPGLPRPDPPFYVNFRTHGNEVLFVEIVFEQKVFFDRF